MSSPPLKEELYDWQGERRQLEELKSEDIDKVGVSMTNDGDGPSWSVVCACEDAKNGIIGWALKPSMC